MWKKRHQPQTPKPSDSDVMWMNKAKSALSELLRLAPGENYDVVHGLLIDVSKPRPDGSRVFIVRTAMSGRREIGHLASDGQIIYTGKPPRTG